MRYTVTCIAFLFFSTLYAQTDLRFWHLSNINGLSGTSVKSIIQDQKGFIWIGTDFGLNRYDAKNIVSFKYDAKNSSTISGNIIKQMVEDKTGVLWIVTDGGLCSFNTYTQKFFRYPLFEKNEKLKSINDIFIDSKNNFWLATDETGWGKMDILNKKYVRENFENQNKDTTALKKVYAIQVIAENKTGNLYFGSRAFSLIIKKESGYCFSNVNRSVYPYPAHTINSIFCDSKNRIWIGAWDNLLHEYDDEKNTLQSVFLESEKKINYSGNEITCINEDMNGWLWIGTRKNGLYLFNPINKQLQHFIKNRLDKTGISNNTIRCIYKDKDGRMWLGTDSGVDIFDPLLNQFEIHYLNNELTNTELVNDFLEVENKLYIATNEGLFVNDHNKPFTLKKSFYYQNEKLSLTKLFKDSFGTIYLGTNKTVFILDTKSISIKTLNTFYNREANSNFDFYNIASSRIVSMAQSHWLGHDVLWISPYGHGLAAFDLKTKAGFVTPVFGKGLRYEHMIHKVFIDSKQNIFCLNGRNGISQNFAPASFADSIFKLLPTKQKTILVNFSPIRSTFLDEKIPTLPSEVFDMMEISESIYWITSTSGGLFKLNLKDNTLVHFDNSNQNLYGMECDANGNLWILSSVGIEFFNIKEGRFYHFGPSDGIPDEGLQGYFYKNKEGCLFAGGKGYFLKFKPEEIKFNTTKPIASITRFKIFDQIADSLLLDKQVNLSYRQNHFSFDLASLNFTDAAENKFQYKLEGLDEQWTSAGARNYVSYTNLNGGNYIFKVKSSNNNNVWSDSASVAIFIKPPLWQYKFFFPAVIVILGAIGFIIYRNRVKNIHRLQTEKLLAEIDAQEKERRRIARDLHDEFGTKMSALKIYLSTYEKFIDHQNQDALNTKKELYSIVDDSMHDLRSLLMDLSPKTLEMHGFASALNDLTNRLSNTHLFHIKSYVSPQLQRFDAKFELPIFRITQELINNSIKHAECKEISIQLFYRDKSIVFSYEDDGKGFDIREIKSAGYGLKNIETRVSLLEGKVSWESSPGNGINVTIEIPYELKN